jgi:hypothetical protein
MGNKITKIEVQLLPPMQLMWELCTGHITRQDDDLLFDLCNEPSIDLPRICRHEYGWIIFCNPESVEHLDAYGFSPAFQQFYKQACEAGAILINLDRDASTIDSLQTFDW